MVWSCYFFIYICTEIQERDGKIQVRAEHSAERLVGAHGHGKHDCLQIPGTPVQRDTAVHGSWTAQPAADPADTPTIFF